MREIWHRTVELFWGHPVLWLPYIATELSAVSLNIASNGLSRIIIRSVMTSRSVLGGQITTYHSAASSKAFLCVTPVSLSFHFLNISLMTIGFVLIARASGSIALGHNPRFASTTASLRSRLPGILWFSAVTGALLMVVGSVTTLPTLLLMLPHFPRGAFEPLTWVCITCGAVAVSFVVAPMALRLIPETRESSVDPQRSLTARKFAMLAAAISTALGLVYNSIRQGTHVHSAFEAHAVGGIATLLADTPLLLLYIALGLLSSGASNLHERHFLPEPDSRSTEST